MNSKEFSVFPGLYLTNCKLQCFRTLEALGSGSTLDLLHSKSCHQHPRYTPLQKMHSSSVALLPLRDMQRPLQLFPQSHGLSLSVEDKHLLQGALPEKATDLLSQRSFVAIK